MAACTAFTSVLPVLPTTFQKTAYHLPLVIPCPDLIRWKEKSVPEICPYKTVRDNLPTGKEMFLILCQLKASGWVSGEAPQGGQ